MSTQLKPSIFSKLNSVTRPSEFRTIDYDVHVYYEVDKESRNEAELLRGRMKERFAPNEVYVGEMIDEPVGPHLLPMWEANLSASSFLDVVEWLMENRGSLVILVHKLTGNHYWDHTAGALFMGGVAPLNLEFLRQLK
jgi:DOPA 4,5-dioxygenase